MISRIDPAAAQGREMVTGCGHRATLWVNVEAPGAYRGPTGVSFHYAGADAGVGLTVVEAKDYDLETLLTIAASAIGCATCQAWKNELLDLWRRAKEVPQARATLLYAIMPKPVPPGWRVLEELCLQQQMSPPDALDGVLELWGPRAEGIALDEVQRRQVIREIESGIDQHGGGRLTNHRRQVLLAEYRRRWPNHHLPKGVTE